jgi:hypothetical protein
VEYSVVNLDEIERAGPGGMVKFIRFDPPCSGCRSPGRTA